MNKIILTATDGEQLLGILPKSWAKVPLTLYANLAAAETMPEKVKATAALVGLPAAPLLADVKHYGAIVEAAPWLFGGELPEAPTPVAYFTHEGTTYHHVGALAKISATQMEALMNFLRDNEGHALNCAPGLLAVLYCPAGKEQTAEVVASAQEAFANLPMSIAWPALADFMRSSGSAALNIRTVSALEEQVKSLVRTLETATEGASASSTFLQKLQRSLFRRWLSNAKKLLSM
jgi:hypothetical protein